MEGREEDISLLRLSLSRAREKERERGGGRGRVDESDATRSVTCKGRPGENSTKKRMQDRETENRWVVVMAK